MKYYLCCIFADPGDLNVTMPRGVQGYALSLIRKNGLSCAIAQPTYRERGHEASDALQYHEIIAFFHQQVTVIPFRFGTVLQESADAALLLERRADHYLNLLHELEGCSEMGIRAIVEEPRSQARQDSSTAAFQEPATGNSGKAYLAQRRIRHQLQLACNKADEAAIERYRAPFEGLFRKFKCEVSRSEGLNRATATVMRSLYFLVPKELLPPFRQAFAELAGREDAKLLLSGPWPPYNFVLPADTAAK